MGMCGSAGAVAMAGMAVQGGGCGPQQQRGRDEWVWCSRESVSRTWQAAQRIWSRAQSEARLDPKSTSQWREAVASAPFAPPLSCVLESDCQSMTASLEHAGSVPIPVHDGAASTAQSAAVPLPDIDPSNHVVMLDNCAFTTTVAP